jgi:hypothetical protein
MSRERSAAGSRAAPRARNAANGFGVKEFLQGLAVGILLGFLICILILSP